MIELDDLVLYFCAVLQNAELGLQPDTIDVCSGIIAVAVPLMVLCLVLGVTGLAILSAFNFIRGRRRDL